MWEQAKKLAQRASWPAVVANAVVLVVWALVAAPHGIFSGDSGVKIAQAHGLIASDFSSPALAYDYDLDPEQRFFPYQAEDFTRVVDGKRQGNYSLFFTGLAALLTLALGQAGLSVLPLAGGIACGVGTFLLARRLGMERWLSAALSIAVVWATPIYFYASQFWEHAAAAGCCTLGLWAMIPGENRRARPAAAGLLFALAGTFRPECYCAVAAAGIALVMMPASTFKERARSGAFYLFTALLVLAGFWLFNLQLAGTWDPAVAANTNTATALGAFTMLIGKVPAAHAVAGLALAAAVLVALIPWRVRAGTWGLALDGVVAAGICWASWQTQADTIARVLTGIFSVTPVLAYGLLAGPHRARFRQLWVFAVLFIAQVLLLERGDNAGGLQLGARFLLPAVPALLVLAAALAGERWQNTHARTTGRALMILPVTALAVLSLFGLQTGAPDAFGIAGAGETNVARLKALSPDVVVTFQGWQSQVLAPALFSGKRFYHVNDRDEARALYRKLADAGVSSLLVTASDPVNLHLAGGLTLRTVATHPGVWLKFHQVELTRSRGGAKTSSPTRSD